MRPEHEAIISDERYIHARALAAGLRHPLLASESLLMASWSHPRAAGPFLTLLGSSRGYHFGNAASPWHHRLMMRKKTVVVVGAGASAEVGLPIGKDLRGQIAGLLDIHFRDDGALQRGDRCIVEAFRVQAARDPSLRRNINPFIHAARALRDALPQAMSIDNLLDTHSLDEHMQVCGKLGICRAILNAERQSALFADRRNDPVRKLDFSNVDGTWFAAFFRLLTQGCRIDDLDDRLQSITFVVFNYDRCIEHFFCNGIQNYYNVNEATAVKALANLNVIHPYGSVGALPWQQPSDSMEFGAEPMASDLVRLFGGIRTFTESTKPDSEVTEQIHMRLAEARLVLFLGFAYHSLNLKLLRLEPRGEWGPFADCYGTAVGLSTPDTSVLSQELASLSGLCLDRIVLRNDLKCADLFSEYWRTLELR